MKLSELQKAIKKKSSKERAQLATRFFKTAKDEYGEGDFFLGIKVPELRQLAKLSIGLDLVEIEILLDSKWHEERFVGIVILVYKYSKYPLLQKEIFDFYLKHAKRINNWDLVDVSADKIVGAYTFDNYKKYETKKLLNSLAESSNLWKRRIAILTCFYYIRNNDFDFILMLSKKLMKDEQDLIHKALGWMLREVGKRDKKLLVQFITEYKKSMPRTTLRYAIEKMSPVERKKMLSSKDLVL